jgi:hypothetical protein
MNEKAGKSAMTEGHTAKLLPVVARQESSAYSAILGDSIPVRGHNPKRESSHGKV